LFCEKKKNNNNKLKASKWRFSIQRGERCVSMGQFKAEVTFQGVSHQMVIQVVEDGVVPLPGRDFLAQFGMKMSGINKIDKIKSIENVTSRFASVFDDNQGT
jgi:hypothetical protein